MVATAPGITPPRPVSDNGSFYYIVASEEQAAVVRQEQTEASEYYGTGMSSRQATIVVARTAEEFSSLTASFYAGTAPGQSPPRIIDLR